MRRRLCMFPRVLQLRVYRFIFLNKLSELIKNQKSPKWRNTKQTYQVFIKYSFLSAKHLRIFFFFPIHFFTRTSPTHFCFLTNILLYHHKHHFIFNTYISLSRTTCCLFTYKFVFNYTFHTIPQLGSSSYSPENSNLDTKLKKQVFLLTHKRLSPYTHLRSQV